MNKQVKTHIEERAKQLRKKLKKEQSYDKTKIIVEEYLSLLLLKEMHNEK
jgi:hypothetical protein